MKKIYSVELDENLVKYIDYLAGDISDRCLTQEEEYLNGYSAMLSQVQQSISEIDTKFTPEELNFIDGRMEIEYSFEEVYDDHDRELMQSIRTKCDLLTPKQESERYTQEYIDNRIEQANADLEALIKEIHNYRDLYEVKDWCEVRHYGFVLCLEEDYIAIDYGTAHFTVFAMVDGGLMVSNIIEVYDEDGDNIWTGKVELGCIKGVEQEDCDNIYLVPDLPEHVNEGTVSLECDIMENYHLNENGEHCYELNSRWWLTIMVNVSWDSFGWVLYDENFKVIERSYLYGLSSDTWISLFKDFLEKYTGHTEAIINTAPNIFHHLKNA